MSFWSFIGLTGTKEIAELQSEVSSMIEENRLLRKDNKHLLHLISEKNAEYIEIMTQQHQNEQQLLTDSILNIHTEIKQINVNIGHILQGLEEIKLLQDKNQEEIANKIIYHHQTLYDLIIKIDQEIGDIYNRLEQDSDQNKKDMMNHIRIMQEQWKIDSNKLLSEIKNHDIDALLILKELKDKNKELENHILSNKDILKNQAVNLLNINEQYKYIDKKTNSIENIQNKLTILAESVHYLWMIMKLVWVDSVISDIDSLTKK